MITSDPPLDHRDSNLADEEPRHPYSYLFETLYSSSDPGVYVQAAVEENESSVLSHATFLLLRYKQYGERTDLQSALLNCRTALNMLPPNQPGRPALLCLLCNTLCLLFERWGGNELLAEAVMVAEESLSTPPARGKEYACLLHVYGKVLCLRGKQGGDRDHISRAVSTLRLAGELSEPDTVQQASILVEYGFALMLQFVRTYDTVVLEESIQAFRSCLSATADTKLLAQAHLSAALGLRYDLQHDPEDLQEAIRLADLCLMSASESDYRRPLYLLSLSLSLGKQREDEESIRLAVSHAERAAALSDDRDSYMSVYLMTHCAQLLKQYGLSGDLGDLQHAAVAIERAIKLSAETDIYFFSMHGLLSHTRTAQFHRTGNLRHLDAAISISRLYAQNAPQDHMHRSQSWYTLAYNLSTRYHYLGDPLDRKETLDAVGSLMKSMPFDQPVPLRDAGVAVINLYRQSNQVEDLELAYAYMCRAQSTGAEIVASFWFLSYLGYISCCRAERYNRISDCNAAINTLRRAVDSCPPFHIRRAWVLRHLGYALQKRFEADGDSSDIDNSIIISQQAVLTCKSTPRHLTATLVTLGDAFQVRFRSQGHRADLEAALASYERGSIDDLGETFYRFRAALSWVSFALENGQTESALEGYGVAVGLLPRLSWLGEGKDRSLEELKARAASLAVDGAAAAISMGRLELAVELLEEGRAIFWQQRLRLRADMDDLRTVAPKLAWELEELGRLLDCDTLKEATQDSDKVIQRQRRLAERWDRLVEEVRHLEEFHDFLKPLRFRDLRSAADNGPIVIINGGALRCDALIISSDRPVFCCPLPNITAAHAQTLSKGLFSILALQRDAKATIFLEQILEAILGLLWHAVGYPVYTALIQNYGSGALRRLYLCPTGPFCLLPLHAAKPVESTHGGLSHFFVCSYTTTLSALLRGKRVVLHRSTLNRGWSMLAISQPETSGHTPLPGAAEEMSILRTVRLPPSLEMLDGPSATVDKVCEQLHLHSWVHVTCHGIYDAENPFLSRLSLADGPLSLSRISALRLPHADFAFLSACHTARGLGSQPDESLHVAGAIQLAGFSGVIATMWGIADKDGPEVTRRVYGYLTRDGGVPQQSEAAEALHQAVAALRQMGLPPSRWAPFIHIGT